MNKRIFLPVLFFTAIAIPWLIKQRSAPAAAKNESARYAAEEALQKLLPPLPVVAEADNGWRLAKQLPLKKTPKELTRDGLMIVPGEERFEKEVSGVHRAALAESLEKDAELIAMARRVLQLPGWQREDWTAKDLMNGGYDARILFPVNAILANAVAKAQDGHLVQAWPDILAVLKTGHRISAAGGPMIDSFMGQTVFGRAVSAAAWAGQQSPDAATARRLAADLLPFEDCGAFYTRAVEGEVRWLLERNRLLASGGPPLEQALLVLYGDMEGGNERLLEHMKEAAQTDWGAATRTLAESYQLAREVPVTTWTDYLNSHPPVKKPESEKEKLERDFSLFYSMAIRGTARVRMARVSLLLRAWMYDHGGQLPDKLDALVPDYLPALPVDPSDGQPLRYSKEKLWSAGTMKTDDGDDASKAHIVQLL